MSLAKPLADLPAGPAAMPAVPRWKRQNYLLWISMVTAVMVLAMGLLLVNQLVQKQAIQESARQRVDSVTALVFYAERELLRLQRELAVQLASPHPIDRDRLQLRYDIFLSGIRWLRDSPSMLALAGRPQYSGVLPKLATLLVQADAVFAKPVLVSAELRDVLAQLDAMQIDLMALSSAASSVESTQFETLADKMLVQSNLILGLAVLQIALLLLASVALVVRQRHQLQEQRAMQAMNEALRQERGKAEAANLAKSQFLANMSHELRTPFNGILGMLQILQTTGLNLRQQDCTSKMERATTSLLALINDILDFSKVESGKLVVNLAPFCLDQLLRDLSEILCAAAGSEQVEVMFDIDPQLDGLLLGDSFRLQQVLTNLASNAVKFTAKGFVVLAARRLEGAVGQAGRVEFSVRDSGIGIAREHQDAIFSAFTQAEASTTRQYGGTGLGLAISQRLVELMGGRLALQSALGSGSCFSFALDLPDVTPAAPVPGTALPEPAVPGPRWGRLPGRRLAGMRILLVEDNLLNQQVAQELLSLEGAQVTIAAHGQLGVAAVAAANPPFDVVLMDLHMPVMDGYGATRAIRLTQDKSRLPIIALTANALASDREACLAAGMNDHIGKPFDMGKLVSLLIRSTAARMPQPVPAAAPGVALPEPTGLYLAGLEVAGLEVGRALARMAGARPLYVRTARDFSASLAGLVPALRATRLAGDQALLRLQLHNLKGHAATLGASALAQQAAALEALHPSGFAAGPFEALLQALEPLAQSTREHLQQAITVLESAAADGAPAGQAPLDLSAARAVLVELVALLENADLDALRCFARGRSVLEPLPADFCAQLERALQDLDLAVALALCTDALRDRSAVPDQASGGQQGPQA